ncbi:MAG: peptidoglycan DD-metalloendopeptidase family protein [Prevotellaceae bacterium]|jgi:murein DD-endopeptidase MepM/ murein hydrolase activator NlpD|nr:peptidoglycan DD-metalloendopeptidase family protein [Prevotellaceae bacterium]
MLSLGKYISITAIVLGCLYGNLNAQDDEEFENRSLQMLNKNKEREAEEITKLSNLIESNNEQLQTGLSHLVLIQGRIDARKSALSNIDRSINALRKQLKEKKQAVEQLQNDLDDVKSSYKNLLNKYYNIRLKDNTWMMLMASESFAQAYKRMKYVREILMLLKAQALKIEEMTGRLNDEIADISKKEQLLSSSISEKQKEMEILRMDEKKSKSVSEDLKRKNAELAKQLKEREESYKLLHTQMLEFIRNEIKNNLASGITDEMLIFAKSFEDLKGLLPQPTIGAIVRPFGNSKSKSVYETVQLTPNRGIDILTAENAEVYAVAKGVVSRIWKQPKGGTGVIVTHGSYYTLYAELGSVFVKKGEEVKARQKIGTVRKSSDGYIMHFELWQSLEPQDPEQWLFN